jgi:steroid delta-isomerase-like uncharacterized protein
MATGMTATDNKAIARFLTEEVFNKGNLDAVDEIISADFTHHDPNTREFSSGPTGYKKFIAGYRNAFPDLQISIQQQIAEGDLVVDRWIGTGTHQSELMGIAPTGKQVSITGMTIHRMAEGKIVETWNNFDSLTMFQQLGIFTIPKL